MTKLIALTTIIAAALVASILLSPLESSAQTYNEKTAKSSVVTYGKKTLLCSLPGKRAVYACGEEEYRRNPGFGTRDYKDPSATNTKKQKKPNDAARMKKEMEAEARAYKKMQEDRKRNTPTTEHCYMKNGNLVCKPA